MTICDTSALGAWIFGEAGGDVVVAEVATGEAAVSAINLAELATLLHRRGFGEPGRVLAEVARSVQVVAFDAIQAADVGDLHPVTSPFGLSLGDRACLALARQRGEPVLTADRAWAELPGSVGVEVVVIR